MYLPIISETFKGIVFNPLATWIKIFLLVINASICPKTSLIALVGRAIKYTSANVTACVRSLVAFIWWFNSAFLNIWYLHVANLFVQLFHYFPH